MPVDGAQYGGFRPVLGVGRRPSGSPLPPIALVTLRSALNASALAPIRRHRPTLALAALGLATAVGAGLRFGTLAHQGYWFDEGVTVLLVHQHVGHMLNLLPREESAPPLYYCVAWVWAHLFGTREAGLRSLSALAGTATIPLAYALGSELASRRVGAVAAGLTACSPLLVWYSQEARSYSLLVLLTGAATLFFLRAMSRPAGRDLAAWALASALALTTHFYAVVAVAPQAAWLLTVHRFRPQPLLALGGVAAVGAALLPLAISQRGTGHTNWIGRIPLDRRLDQLRDQFIGWIGAPRLPFLLGAGGLALGAVLLLRSDHRERRGAVVAAALGAAGLGLALGLVAINVDDFLSRNVIAVWLPLALAVAIGMGSRRAGVLGPVTALVVCGAWISLNVAINTDRVLQRPDWRRVSAALGPAGTPRLIVVKNHAQAVPLRLYQPGLERMRGTVPVAVRELDVVGNHIPKPMRFCWWGPSCNLRRAPLPSRPPPGFHRFALVRTPIFRVWRLASRHPRRLNTFTLRRELGDIGIGAALLQIPGRGTTALARWPA